MTARYDRKVALARALARAEEPLGPPPDWLDSAQRQAWHDIVVGCPVLCRPDEIELELAARELAYWREDLRERKTSRPLYRTLGRLLVPMRDRRRLLFPERFLH